MVGLPGVEGGGIWLNQFTISDLFCIVKENRDIIRKKGESYCRNTRKSPVESGFYPG